MKGYNYFYNKQKDIVRNMAIDWQSNFAEHNYSYGEIAYFQEIFERLGRRYGLLREFKENGII
jgi:hypothetical protein